MNKASRFDPTLFGITILLTSLGILAIFTASAPFSYIGEGSAYRWALGQLKWFILGLGFLFLFSKIDYHFYQKLDKLIVFFTILLLIAVFIPGLGKEIRGTHRWITFGSFQIQPSEFAKLGVIIYIACSIVRKKDKIDSFISGFIPYLIVISLIFFLVMMGPDLGSALVIAIVGFVVLYAGGAKLMHMLYVGMLGIVPLYFSIFQVGYRKNRIVGFLDPESDPLGIGFQPIRLRIALGSGGIFGLGPGQGKEKLFYLPTPHTDSIFAVIGEEFGLIGTTFVIFLFILFTIIGLRVVKRTKDDLGKLLAIGLTSLISIQAIINMGVACVILPTTGLALPFISYGGSSLLTSLIAVGILLNISRQKRESNGA